MPFRDWADAEYSRIYHTVIDDPKFAEVFDDDRRWAAYTRLLMAAESSYPAPVPLPRWLADDVLEHLVSVRILELVRGSSYRVVGLKAEREGRSSGRAAGGKARVAGAQRDEHGRFVAGENAGDAGDAGENAGPANVQQPAGPASPAKPSRAEPSLDSPQPPAGGGPSRANGTSKRQLAAAAQARADEAERMKAWRRNQRQLAYARGAITEAQHADMNGRDAPLEEIPDWVERLTKLRDVDEPDPLPAFLGGHERGGS